MNHSEALELMATERYLLDELTQEQREGFEEHFFECQECAMDVRAGSAFVTETKMQLPHLAAQPATSAVPARPRAEAELNRKKPWWSFWSMPAFAAPVFAGLLAVIAYQNFSLIPALRSAAAQPGIVPWTMLHTGTRGVEPTHVQADRKRGALVLIELPTQPLYASYAFELFDPRGKRLWSQTVQRSAQSSDDGLTVPLEIPGTGLQQGSYTLTISGISSDGTQAQIGRRTLDVLFDQ